MITVLARITVDTSSPLLAAQTAQTWLQHKPGYSITKLPRLRWWTFTVTGIKLIFTI